MAVLPYRTSRVLRPLGISLPDGPAIEVAFRKLPNSPRGSGVPLIRRMDVMAFTSRTAPDPPTPPSGPT
jgi:hypothetical protein